MRVRSLGSLLGSSNEGSAGVILEQTEEIKDNGDVHGRRYEVDLDTHVSGSAGFDVIWAGIRNALIGRDFVEDASRVMSISISALDEIAEVGLSNSEPVFELEPGRNQCVRNVENSRTDRTGMNVTGGSCRDFSIINAVDRVEADLHGLRTAELYINSGGETDLDLGEFVGLSSFYVQTDDSELYASHFDESYAKYFGDEGVFVSPGADVTIIGDRVELVGGNAVATFNLGTSPGRSMQTGKARNIFI